MAASTTLLTDAATMVSNGPTAATATKAAGTPEIDYVGMLQLYRDSLDSIKLALTQLKNSTDGADPNLTTINNDLLTFS